MKHAFVGLLLLGVGVFVAPTTVFASYTLGADGTWASAGGANSSTVLANAESGGNVALAGHTLTVTNNGTADDGSGFDTFNIGNITDAGSGSVSILGTQADTNNLTVNISSATVGSDFNVANTTGNSGNGVTTTISGALSTGTLEVTNNQLMTGSNTSTLIVDGNFTATGLVTVTGGSASGSDAVLSLEGSTISTGGISLSSTGSSYEGTGFLQIGGSAAQTVSGAINSSAPEDFGTVEIGENTSGTTSNNITMQGNIGNINPIGNLIIEGTGTNTFNGTVTSDFVSIVSNAVFNNNVGATDQIDFWADGTMTVANGVNVTGPIFNDTDISGAANLGTLVLQGTSTITGNVGDPGSELKQISLTGSSVTDTVTGGVATQSISLGNNTLHINGTYEQSANGTIATTINSSTAYGNIVATGNASISSATHLNVTVAGALPNTATTFNLIDDNGSAGINVPNSLSVTGSSRIFRAMLLSGDLILYMEAPGGFSVEASAPNTQGVATALDNITENATGDMGHVIDELIGLNATEVNEALNAMLPLTGYNMQAATQIMDDFVDTQMAHLNSPMNAAITNLTGMSSGDMPLDTTSWAQALGTSAHQSPRGTSNGYNFADAGGMVGIEKFFTEAFRMGLAAGDGYSWVASKDENGKIDINAAEASFYGRYKEPESPWYVNYSLLYTHNEYTSTRDISVTSSDNRVAKASYAGNLYGAALEGGYGINVLKTVVTPNFLVTYDRLNMSKYHEKNAGALDLQVQEQHYNQLELAPGFKIELPMECSWGILSPEVHAHYLWDVISQQEQIVASFAGGGAAFTTQGYKPGNHGVDLGTGISLATLDNFTVTLQYDFEDRAEYYSNTGLLNVAYQF